MYRFHARDVHLVLRSREGTNVPFVVQLDGDPPGAAHGLDVDEDGSGTLVQPKLYQLIRQPGPITDRTFAITFLTAGSRSVCLHLRLDPTRTRRASGREQPEASTGATGTRDEQSWAHATRVTPSVATTY